MRRRTAVVLGATAILCALALAAFLPRPPADTQRAFPGLEPPLPEPLRVAVVGTSLTERYDWPAAAADALAACIGGPVALTVLARGGASSRWGAGQAGALRAAAPHVALIEFTVNDADLRRRVSLAEAEANHRALVAALRADGASPRIVLVTLNRARGLRAALRPRIAAHEAQYDALARELDLGRLSIGPDWRAALADEAADRLLPDGIHPAPEAVASVVTPRVSAELRRLAGHGPDGAPCAAPGAAQP